MKRQSIVLIIAGAICAALALPASAGNLLTNGDFEDFTGPFINNPPPDPNGPITTNSDTWNKWRVWERFQSVDSTTLIDPTTGPTPFPPGWGGDNFAQHSQALNPATGTGDQTDQIKQGIDGSRIIPGVPVNLSFKYINTQPGRLIRVTVYGIDGNQVWSQFASFRASTHSSLRQKRPARCSFKRRCPWITAQRRAGKLSRRLSFRRRLTR
jgi:hypothetical protein